MPRSSQFKMSNLASSGYPRRWASDSTLKTVVAVDHDAGRLANKQTRQLVFRPIRGA
jgi:hypothetical protein